MIIEPIPGFFFKIHLRVTDEALILHCFQFCVHCSQRSFLLEYIQLWSTVFQPCSQQYFSHVVDNISVTWAAIFHVVDDTPSNISVMWSTIFLSWSKFFIHVVNNISVMWLTIFQSHGQQYFSHVVNNISVMWSIIFQSCGQQYFSHVVNNTSDM